jgi:hypothetical protein
MCAWYEGGGGGGGASSSGKCNALETAAWRRGDNADSRHKRHQHQRGGEAAWRFPRWRFTPSRWRQHSASARAMRASVRATAEMK